MNADGSGQTKLTDNPAFDEGPSWSPDGEKIAFDSRRNWNSDIYVMNADGSDQSPLVQPLYTGPESERIDTVTFATASTASDGGFSSNVWFSIPNTPLKLTDDDRLSVDVILPDGRTTQAADVRWAEGLIKTLTLNVRTERPAPPNKAPTVTIASPSTGKLFQTTDSISFTGSATDPEDGPLAGASLVWTSNVDGQLGTGGSISATLSAGPHQITLTATDSDRALWGEQGSASVSVMVVLPNKAPTVTIASPSTGMMFQTTDSISFTGSATDPEDVSLSGASLVWTSSSAGQLGTGGSISATLSAGPHQITLTATDSQGAQASSALSVMITAPVPVGPVALPPMDNQAMPHIFVGNATIGGQAAPDGTKVSVWVSDYNAPVGTGTVSGGQYSVKTFKYGGAFAGKTLIFKIADKDTGTTAVWESGMATVLDLSTD